MFHFSKWLILIIAALLFILTFHNFLALPVIVVFGLILKVLSLNAMITVNDSGITIKKLNQPHHYSWEVFSNVIARDGILTLDFNNNKILQILIKEFNSAEKEFDFNEYCKRKLLGTQG